MLAEENGSKTGGGATAPGLESSPTSEENALTSETEGKELLAAKNYSPAATDEFEFSINDDDEDDDEILISSNEVHKKSEEAVAATPEPVAARPETAVKGKICFLVDSDDDEEAEVEEQQEDLVKAESNASEDEPQKE